MRNFSKSLISMAAVMAVGSAMAAGAMAADLTATYAGDKVTFSGVTAGKSQYTLLVVEGTKAEDATDYTYNATEATIKQIDQNDAGVAFTEAVVGTLADGSYKVLVGNNDGTIDSGIFTVGGEDDDNPYASSTRLLGDVDGNTFIEVTDSTQILAKDAGLSTLSGEDLQAADCDDNGFVEVSDSTQILAKDAGLSYTVDFTKTIATKANYVAE